MDNNPGIVTEWHHLYNYMHCRSLQLFGYNVHVNGLENLFLCLKFTINVFNTSNCPLLKQKINALASYPKNGYYICLVTSGYRSIETQYVVLPLSNW
jgi:hypothetical protein